MQSSALVAVCVLLVSLWPVALGSSILRKKPQVWEVNDDIDQAFSLPEIFFDEPPEANYIVPASIEPFDDEDISDLFEIDEENIGLCVLPKHCANRDGSGIINPRLNLCIKPTKFCKIGDLLEDYPTCGISKPNLFSSDRIMFSSNANSAFGEWPWVAMITERRGNDDFFLCNAVLIDSLHLLTIAHCFDKLENLDIFVRLGEYNLENEHEPSSHIEIEAETISMHPNYNNRNMHNDIAVIRLKHAAPSTVNIAPICLPSPIEVRKFQVASNRHSARCITTGWGLKSSNKNTPMSTIPRKVSLSLVDQSRCQKLLRKTKLGKRFELDSNFLCAGGEEGEDSCIGDGGSPLMCQQNDGAFTLVGLVSWGVGCGRHNVPGVYTNVAEFADFIEKSKQFMTEEDD